LDEISAGDADWQRVLEAFWRDFKPKTAEVMEQKPSDITAELDKFLAPYLFLNGRMAPIHGFVLNVALANSRCAVVVLAHLSLVPTIRNANSPANSPSPAALTA